MTPLTVPRSVSAAGASLVVALFILTSVGTAFAHSVWVLWVETLTLSSPEDRAQPPVSETIWEIGLAVSTEERCNGLRTANARERAAMLRKNVAPTTVMGAAGSVKAESDTVTLFTGRGSISRRYVCLPDTVDPRGPKR